MGVDTAILMYNEQVEASVSAIGFGKKWIDDHEGNNEGYENKDVNGFDYKSARLDESDVRGDVSAQVSNPAKHSNDDRAS